MCAGLKGGWTITSRWNQVKGLFVQQGKDDHTGTLAEFKLVSVGYRVPQPTRWPEVAGRWRGIKPNQNRRSQGLGFTYLPC